MTKNLKMCMMHSGTQEPDRWSVLDQSDQSFVLGFPLVHFTTTTLNAENMIYRRVFYTFISRLGSYEMCLSFSGRVINYFSLSLKVTMHDCVISSELGNTGE